MTSVLDSRFAAVLILSLVSLPLHAGSDVKLIEGETITRFEHVAAGRYIDLNGERHIAIVFSTMNPKNIPLLDAWGGIDQYQEWVNDNGVDIAMITFTEGQEPDCRIDVHTDIVQFVTELGEGCAFKSLELGKSRVAGNVHQVMQSGTLSGKFDALLITTSYPEPVSGPAILESPVARVMLTLETSLRRRDFAAARELLVPDGESRPVIDRLEFVDSEIFDQTLDLLFGAPGELKKILVSPETRLHVDEDLAILFVKLGGGDTRESDVIGQVLKRVDGVWKLN